MDWFPTMLRLAGAEDSIPDDRYIDGVDQTSFLLARRRRLEPQVPLLLARLRRSRRCAVAEWKFMLASTSDDDHDVMNIGGFSGVTQKYTYGRLYNLYLDPEGDAQLHGPQARLPRGVPARDRQPHPHVREVPAQEVVGGVG